MLCIRELSKKFGSVEALKSVSLEVKAGEIHGLVGANGAGKTTLLNILFGNAVIAQTGGYLGQISIAGSNTFISSPLQAISLGIGMVHQESALIPGMTAAENIKIGRETAYRLTELLFGRDFALRRARQDEIKSGRLLSMLGLEPCAHTLVRNLSPSCRPFVEIAREIDKSCLRILLLDEPTAVLGSTDADRLAQTLRQVASQGTALLYVSHRLEEVTAVCDRVTVLRGGQVAGRFEQSEYDLHVLAECMTGRKITKVWRQDRQVNRQVLMRIDHLHVNMPGERLTGANLEIRRGEILGVSGLSGHGKLALGPGIMGIFPTSGRIFLDGSRIPNPTPASMLANGVCCVPHDRNRAGLLMDHSVEENLVFTALHAGGQFLKNPRWGVLSLIDKASVRDFAERCVAHFKIKCGSVRQKVGKLSGGNQQKVSIARALAVRPRVLLVGEPTRGVDIEAKEIILRMFLELNWQLGMTVVIASSELDELKRICDRIAVVCQGRVTEILAPQDEDWRFMLAFSGKTLELG